MIDEPVVIRPSGYRDLPDPFPMRSDSQDMIGVFDSHVKDGNPREAGSEHVPAIPSICGGINTYVGAGIQVIGIGFVDNKGIDRHVRNAEPA